MAPPAVVGVRGGPATAEHLCTAHGVEVVHRAPVRGGIVVSWWATGEPLTAAAEGRSRRTT